MLRTWCRYHSMWRPGRLGVEGPVATPARLKKERVAWADFNPSLPDAAARY
jgi:hypothetical protein